MSASNSNGTIDQADGGWRIEGESPANDLTVEGLRTCLRAHNEDVSGLTPDDQSFTWVVRDCHGNLIGGLAAEARYGWMHIRLLWINADQRGGGAGRALMVAVEDKARSLDLHGLLTDTSSFQAPGFYTRCGYETIGEVADLPPGYTTYYFMKRLKPIGRSTSQT